MALLRPIHWYTTLGQIYSRWSVPLTIYHLAILPPFCLTPDRLCLSPIVFLFPKRGAACKIEL
jgi:hypothetical protein